MQGDLSTRTVGQEGEKAAIEYLKSSGFTVICTNFRTPVGEIDIIAKKDNILHFLEVKSRHGKKMGDPLESLTWTKRKRIRRTAEWFLAKHREYKMPCLFGAIGVEMSCYPPRIEFMPGSFE